MGTPMQEHLVFWSVSRLAKLANVPTKTPRERSETRPPPQAEGGRLEAPPDSLPDAPPEEPTEGAGGGQ